MEDSAKAFPAFRNSAEAKHFTSNLICLRIEGASVHHAGVDPYAQLAGGRGDGFAAFESTEGITAGFFFQFSCSCGLR
jgi:hypothetical protein